MLFWFDIGEDVIQTIVAHVGVWAIVVAVRSHTNSRNQPNFQVIVSCTARFQEGMRQNWDDDRCQKIVKRA